MWYPAHLKQILLRQPVLLGRLEEQLDVGALGVGGAGGDVCVGDGVLPQLVHQLADADAVPQLQVQLHRALGRGGGREGWRSRGGW